MYGIEVSVGVRESIEALKVLKMELQGRVEDSVIERFDQVIHQLELAESTPGEKLSSAEVLRIVAACLELIPAVANLIAWLQTLK